MSSDALSANLDMTLREWIERYQNEIVFERVHYRGLPTWKNVVDLWVYQKIIWENEIDLVVEIGVRHGGIGRNSRLARAVAARRFVAENEEFVIDQTREKFLLTYAPGGFLKRVKSAPA